MTSSLQQAMFQEMGQKEIFEQAKDYAFDYADKALERNVYPTPEAISNLSQFEEPLPDTGSKAADVLRQLHEFGSPASVSQIGGRYFGLVNGGVIPTTLATQHS